MLDSNLTLNSLRSVQCESWQSAQTAQGHQRESQHAWGNPPGLNQLRPLDTQTLNPLKRNKGGKGERRVLYTTCLHQGPCSSYFVFAYLFVDWLIDWLIILLVVLYRKQLIIQWVGLQLVVQYMLQKWCTWGMQLKPVYPRDLVNLFLC